MRLKTKAALFSFLAFVASNLALSAADPVVSHVYAQQRDGTQLVDITYDLDDPDSSQLTVSVAVSDNAGATYTLPATSFTGTGSVAPGKNKKITWDAGKDWPNKFSANMRFRVTAQDTAPVPTGMVLIPAGSFTMGDTFNEGISAELPTHTVYVNALYMDRYEVTKALWDEVRTWAVAHGYGFEDAGLGKASNHPVQEVYWYDVVKWCNARSEKEGRVPAYYTDTAQTTLYRTGQVDVQNGWVKWNVGYRLPTEAEWEKAARGGVAGQRYPWGNTISHSQANYYSYWSGGRHYYLYDVSPTAGYHPDYDNDPGPYTSPVGSFAANTYGLYDMAGNVWEWCWDWYGSYSNGSQNNPRGPSSGLDRVFRGGSWNFESYDRYCRVSLRNRLRPNDGDYGIGFRCVLSSFQ